MPGSPWPGPDGIARRTNPLTAATGVVPMVLGLFALTVPLMVGSGSSSSSSSSSSPWLFVLFALVLVGTGVGQAARWATTTYAVFPTELVVDEGLLTREHRVLPLARVQQADTHQSLVGQLIGLTELKVDVAGATGSTQVKLRLLDADTALAVRDYVLRRRAELHAAELDPTGVAARDADVPPPAGEPWSDRIARNTATLGTAMGAGETEVLQLGPGRLVLGALTHSIVVLGIPVVLTAALWWSALLVADPGNRMTGFTVGGIAIVAGFAVVVIAFTSLVQAVLGQYGFTVSLAGDDVHLRYGLLETRNLTVPRRRVQQVTFVDNPLRRLLGLVEVHLHTAAAPGGGQSTTRFVVPVVATAQVDALLVTMMGDHRWQIPPLTPRSAVAKRRAIVRRAILLLAVLIVPAVALRPLGLVLVTAVVLAVPWGRAAHRRAGYGTSTTVVAVSHGVLHHRIDLVPLERVQSTRSDQTPMQRLSDMSTLRIDTAGSSRAPYLWDLDRDVADSLRRELPRRSTPVRS